MIYLTDSNQTGIIILDFLYIVGINILFLSKLIVFYSDVSISQILILFFFKIHLSIQYYIDFITDVLSQ